ncbi:ferredoxin [Fulvivirga kasyanovii]|uniref:Ferredoxin n=1 Tax=Fulvivirga kasyanovii TaxID=396812 RepID=A0ABW9RK79_9BACT|nr:ferredoxin [Fulvivirga kasyanovii]MTI24488.1 ferredoxin [Fulvivirga kasyanovii]
MPKIIHYRSKCIGCNICYEMQPDIWRMSQRDGKATLVGGELKKGLYILPITNGVSEMLAREVAKACPVNIIKVG